MAARTRDLFTTIHSEGALLPPDLLQRIAEGGKGLEGLRPEDYHLSGERLNEAISRAWNRLQGAWANFQAARADLPEKDAGTGITRDRWLMPLFTALDFGRLPTAQAVQIEGKSYAISHRWNNNVPIHLVGFRLDLDRRTPGAAGAAIASPHSLLQVYLNRTDETLWGIVSNGLKLRILRDNASLTRQAYIEFDLESMMEGELYPDFVMLYLLLHQSRLEAERPSDSWLEAWMKAAQEQGTRALDQLRQGVEHAIGHLGTGFVAHPSNTELRDKLYDGTLDKQDYYRQLLRLVYRLLFLFAAEDRGLLLDPNADEAAKQRYAEYYSMQRLRHLAERLKGTRHRDLFDSLRLVMQLLSDENVYADEQREIMGLPALGGWLFREEAVQDVIGCAISNRDLLEAVRALAYTHDAATRTLRPIDYKNLGPEELGSVYESLLELHPEINLGERLFLLSTAAGHERKTTGSYYTPDSLVQALLDSALNPVIAEARKSADPEAALLDLKVCDPACGSGHFLISAARRMARALASVRTGEEEPPPAATRHAVRDVIGRCIYGVDINPMAVELCKVNLWMEALEPGKPLSFLDHRIQVGNSLLGTTPALIAKGIPDEAFNPIEGDDKNFVSGLKRQNREERKGQQTMFAQLEATTHASTTALATELRRMEAIADDTLDGVRAREEYYHRLATSPEYVQARLLADAWVAAFVWEKRADAILPMTDLVFRRVAQKDQGVIHQVGGEVARLADQYQFFHWHVAFPNVFHVPPRIEDAENEVTGWNGGFSCVLGNPPWEQVVLNSEEFFAVRLPEIVNARNSSQRDELLEKYRLDEHPAILEYQQKQRQLSGESNFTRHSCYFPLTGAGRLNTYSLFAERVLSILSPTGHMGMILPSDILVSYGKVEFWDKISLSEQFISAFDFENGSKKGGGRWFKDVHPQTHFMLLTIGGQGIKNKQSKLAFSCEAIEDIFISGKFFTLNLEDLHTISPNTKTLLLLQAAREKSIVQTMAEAALFLGIDSSINSTWGVGFEQDFNASSDSGYFKTLEKLQQQTSDLGEVGPVVHLSHHIYLPLCEGKLGNIYNHRYGTFKDVHVSVRFKKNIPAPETPLEELMRPDAFAIPRYWIAQTDFEGKSQAEDWTILYRFSAYPNNERTMIAWMNPPYPTNHITPRILLLNRSPIEYAWFLAGLLSYPFDFYLRRRMARQGIDFFILKQVPLPAFHDAIGNWVVKRVLELSYTAWDLYPFGCDIGYDGPPFIWDEDRRFLMRCELDALYFHLYQIARDDVDYIMETFPIVKRKDEAAFGEYRTKRVILQMYDQMDALPRINVPHPNGLDEPYLVPDVSQYETWLNPPPADPSVAHQNSERPAWLDRPRPKPAAPAPLAAAKQAAQPPSKSKSKASTAVKSGRPPLISSGSASALPSEKTIRASLPEDVRNALSVADGYLIGNHIAQICYAAQGLGLDVKAYTTKKGQVIGVAPVMSDQYLLRIRMEPDDGAIRIYVEPEVFAQWYKVSAAQVGERLGAAGWVHLEPGQVAGWIEELEALFREMGR